MDSSWFLIKAALLTLTSCIRSKLLSRIACLWMQFQIESRCYALTALYHGHVQWHMPIEKKGVAPPAAAA